MNIRRCLLGAFAGGWIGSPGLTGAQPAAKLSRIGWLDFSSSAENLGVFVQSVKARGWVDGKTFKLEYRGANGQAVQLAAAAAELVRLPADVIVVPGSVEAVAARKATSTTPLVMAGIDDPVGLGLIETLARPGGNVTGLATARGELSAKLLSLLREQFPRATTGAVLWDSTDPDHRYIVGHLQSAARALSLGLNLSQVRHHSEVEPAFAAIKKQGNQLLVIPPSAMLVPRWVADLALKHGLPLASTSPAYAYEGGLMAYSADWQTVFAQVAGFVDRILKGEKPAGLPVELPTRYKLVINARTAQALGVAIAPGILLRADHVVE
jgi:putative tryptophan/tyrosine transport system substrate-binding protein